MVTNVELDHHSRWGSRAELIEAFARFAAPAAGLALRRRTPSSTRSPAGAPHRRVSASTPTSPGPAELELRGARVATTSSTPAPRWRRSSSPGFDADAAAGGARRASRGCCAASSARARATGAEIYDDYAHHPTEVAATLEALRELEPRRLIAVFQPHLYSRTKALAERFGAALAAADEVGVLDVYAAREQPVGELAGVSGLDVARAAADHAGGRPVWWLRDLATAERALAPRLREGDLLVTIGAGDVFRARRGAGGRAMSRARRRRARLPARAADHGARRRQRRALRAARDRGRAGRAARLGRGRGPRGRGRRLGLEPAGRRRRGPRPGAQARRRARRDRARRRRGSSAAAASACRRLRRRPPAGA